MVWVCVRERGKEGRKEGGREGGRDGGREGGRWYINVTKLIDLLTIDTFSIS